MTSVNMALTAISKELNIGQADEQVSPALERASDFFVVELNLVFSFHPSGSSLPTRTYLTFLLLENPTARTREP